jgi:hypothetical protein
LEPKKKEVISLPPLNQDLIGTEFCLGPFLIDQNEVIKLAELLDDPDIERIATQHDNVPPYYLITFLGDKDPVGGRPDILFAGLHGQFFTSIKIGDILVGEGRVSDVYKKQGRSGEMIFVVEEVVYYNQQGEKVAKLQLSWVRRDRYEPDIGGASV